MDLESAPAATPGTSLRTNRLGTIGIVFFVVAAAAPLVGMTGAVPFAIVAGNGAGAPAPTSPSASPCSCSASGTRR